MADSLPEGTDVSNDNTERRHNANEFERLHATWGGLKREAKNPVTTKPRGEGRMAWCDHLSRGYLAKGQQLYLSDPTVRPYLLAGSILREDGARLSCADVDEAGMWEVMREGLPDPLLVVQNPRKPGRYHVWFWQMPPYSGSGKLYWQGRHVGEWRAAAGKDAELAEAGDTEGVGMALYPGEDTALVRALASSWEHPALTPEERTLLERQPWTRPVEKALALIGGLQPRNRNNGLVAALRPVAKMAAHRTCFEPLLVEAYEARFTPDELVEETPPVLAVAHALDTVASTRPDGKPAAAGPADGVVRNHVELASLWAEQHGADWLYVPELKEWRWFEEGWHRDGAGKVALSIAEVAERAWESKQKAEKSGSVVTLGGAERVARPMRASSITRWDRDPSLAGLPGGQVLELHEDGGWAVRPEANGDRVTHRLGCVPAEKLEWSGPVNRWLMLKFPDPAVSLWVQRFVGSLLHGRPEQVGLWIIGPTATGKSTFLQLVRSLLASYALTMPRQILEVSKVDQSAARDYRLAAGPGKRVLLVSEWSESARLDADFLSGLTGGDPITARPIRQAPFVYDPTFQLLIVSNNLPSESQGFTEPVARRMAVVEMLEGHKETIDREAADRLAQEHLPQFAAWALEGYRAWRTDGLRPFPPYTFESEPSFIDTVLQQALSNAQMAKPPRLVEDPEGLVSRADLAAYLLPLATEMKPGRKPTVRSLSHMLTKALTLRTVRGVRCFPRLRISQD